MPVLELLHDHDTLLEHALEEFASIFEPPEIIFDPIKDECEQSLLAFMKHGWHILHPESSRRFVDGWPVGAISEALEAVSALQIRNLLINCPPGFNKSLQVAVYWQAWSWIKDPAHSWVNITYSDDNAIRDSNRCRELVKSPWFQNYWGDKVRIRRDQDNASAFYLSRGGYRIATSIRGSGTGKRADTIVGDDLMKIEDFSSKAMRDEANHSWDTMAATRARDPKTFCKVMIAQRGHRKDPPGHVIEQGDYTVLRIPMRYVPSKKCFIVLSKDAAGNSAKTWEDPRTEEGQLAWPERFPEEEVKKQELVLGADAAALFQQDPESQAAGSMFSSDDTRYFSVEELSDGNILLVLEPEPGRLYKVRPQECAWFQIADTAMKTGEENDYTVVTTMGLAPRGYVLIWHVARKKIQVPLQYDFVIGQLVYGPPGCQILYQGVEDKASGTGILQDAALRGTPMVPLKADIDKKRRAANASVYHRTHQLLLKKSAPWLVETNNELWSFPGGEHDDIVDTIAHGCNQAKIDALLKQGASGELVLYPSSKEDKESEIHPAKRPFPIDSPNIDGGVVKYAGLELYFGDD